MSLPLMYSIISVLFILLLFPYMVSYCKIMIKSCKRNSKIAKFAGLLRVCARMYDVYDPC